jgi:hypothetical protein
MAVRVGTILEVKSNDCRLDFLLVFLPENLEAGFQRQVAAPPELQFGLFAECQLTSHDLIQRRD